MKQTDLLKFFLLHRQIFGVCPHSGEIFRLSECKISVKGQKQTDWLDKIETAHSKLDAKEDRVRENARAIGQQKTKRAVRKIDKLFTPRNLNHKDAYPIFNPIDYIVYNGMERDTYKNIILMDGKKTSSEMKRIQHSIEKVVEKEKYEWITFRIEDNGKINME